MSTSDTKDTPGVDAPTLGWAMKKLAAAFPGSFGDEQKAMGVAALWRELLDTHPWVTGPVFRKGVTRICWEHKGDFLPAPAVALDYFHAAQQEVRRETEKALPPPPKPGGPDDPGQQGAKAAARAYLMRLGLSSGVPSREPRKRRLQPLTEDEVVAAYERRGMAE